MFQTQILTFRSTKFCSINLLSHNRYNKIIYLFSIKLVKTKQK